MQKKQRFITDFTKYKKEVFLPIVDTAIIGITGNADFATAPVKADDLKKAYNDAVLAAPNAVPNNIDGQRIFKPLRQKVEGMMTKLAEFAQLTIGDKPDRMTASKLPLSKDPAARPTDINFPVEKAKLAHGKTEGQIEVSGKSNPAADGIIVDARQPDGTWKEMGRVKGFKITFKNLKPDEVIVLQIRYWNNEGEGPRLLKPLAIVV